LLFIAIYSVLSIAGSLNDVCALWFQGRLWALQTVMTMHQTRINDLSPVVSIGANFRHAFDVYSSVAIKPVFKRPRWNFMTF